MATLSAAEQTKLNDAVAALTAATTALTASTDKITYLQQVIRDSLSIQAAGGSYIANELGSVNTGATSNVAAKLATAKTNVSEVVTGATISG